MNCPVCGRPNRSTARHCIHCGKPTNFAVSAAPAQFLQPPLLPPSPHISLTVEGNLSGTVVIGDNHFQLRIGNQYGGEVNVLPSRAIQPPQLRQGPINERPGPFTGLLDREAELQRAVQGLSAGQPVEISGPNGSGKTCLLNTLAHHFLTAQYPDGVFYVSTINQPVEDLLQRLFDSFYNCGCLYKATPAEVRQKLRDRRALVIFDDITLPRERVEALLEALPGWACLLASPERRLWLPGQAVELGALPQEAALQLVARGLGRSLGQTEIPAAKALIQALAGHPLRILQAVSAARRAQLPLTDFSAQIQGPVPHEVLYRFILAGLSESERRIVAALAALRSAPATATDLAILTGVTQISQVLDDLRSLHLVQATSRHYNLTGSLAQDLQTVVNLTPWRERLLDHYTAWAERNLHSPALLLAEMDTLLQVLRWAVEARHWAAAHRLARAVQALLALEKRWSTWGEVLHHSLSAARGLANRSAEAWALHQLGTRSICLGEKEAAKQALTSALKLREELGEKAAALLTRHNLNLLISPSDLPKKTAQKYSRPASKNPWRTFLVISGGLVTLFILTIIVVWAAIIIFFPASRTEAPPDPAGLTNTPAEKARQMPDPYRKHPHVETIITVMPACAPTITFSQSISPGIPVNPWFVNATVSTEILNLGDIHDLALSQDAGVVVFDLVEETTTDFIGEYTYVIKSF